jgi:UDP-glucuronate 4-epimerase
LILVTGCAGFIGFHLSKALLDRGEEVVGIDNLNAYYDPALKNARLKQLTDQKHFLFEKIDIADNIALQGAFKKHKITKVVNLAAQAGVRYSIENPAAYVSSNLVGFANILECCRHHEIKHLVYASSSSAYGANTKQPFDESQNTDHPISFYAATKRSNELMAHSYASLYGLPCTGLRFFTVYGPWGRPDMALFKFTKNILAGEPIDVYGHGKMQRDFTYVDDIVEGIVRVLSKAPEGCAEWDSDEPDPAISYAPCNIYNIGNGSPISLMAYIGAIERAVGKKAKCNFLPAQAGDLVSTHADTNRLEKSFLYKADTLLENGVKSFVEWYVHYYSGVSA